MREELLFISKKLVDVAKEIDCFTEDEKQYIIGRAEKISPGSLVELYNTLGEFGKLE